MRRPPSPGRLTPAALCVAFGIACVLVGRWAASRPATLPSPPPPLEVALEPLPELAVAARLVVRAPGADGLVVHIAPDAHHAERTWTMSLPETGKLSTALLGLTPAATSHVEVVAKYSGRPSRSSGDRAVTTPAMDPRIPTSLPVAVHDGSAKGLVLLSMNGGEEVGGVATIVDRDGHVVWYRRCGGGAYTFAFLPNGHLVLHQFHDQAFEEITLDGAFVRKWTDPGSINGADGHDFGMLPTGNGLLFGAVTHSTDSRPYFPEGTANATRWDDTVSEVTPAGAVVWRWSSWAHITEDEITQDPREPVNPKDYEVVHANAIEPLRDGTMLLSLRNLSAVVKIDRRTGDILWRLGGKKSDFRFVGDPLGRFSRQHDARWIGPGRLLLFDNGNLRNPPESRAVEYRIDQEAKTATMIWQHRRIPPVFSKISGSAERLPNGHTLISWGPQGIVSEVDAASNTVWEVRPPEFGVYRSRFVSNPYP
jgi:hypothetical protein